MSNACVNKDGDCGRARASRLLLVSQACLCGPVVGTGAHAEVAGEPPSLLCRLP